MVKPHDWAAFLPPSNCSTFSGRGNSWSHTHAATMAGIIPPIMFSGHYRPLNMTHSCEWGHTATGVAAFRGLKQTERWQHIASLPLAICNPPPLCQKESYASISATSLKCVTWNFKKISMQCVKLRWETICIKYLASSTILPDSVVLVDSRF